MVGNVVLEISEKFAGAFETLVSLGPLKAPKITQTPSPIAKSTGSTAILIALFVRAVRRYLAGFKKVAYVKVPDAGTIAGGRLDVTRTLRLRAKGMAHQVAFDRSVLSADLPFNRCIYAALTEVERPRWWHQRIWIHARRTRPMPRLRTHPGELLREEYLVPLGLSARALAKLLGVPANRLTEIMRGTRDVCADTAIRLGRYFGRSTLLAEPAGSP